MLQKIWCCNQRVASATIQLHVANPFLYLAACLKSSIPHSINMGKPKSLLDDDDDKNNVTAKLKVKAEPGEVTLKVNEAFAKRFEVSNFYYIKF